jgi:hypothetical protein
VHTRVVEPLGQWASRPLVPPLDSQQDAPDPLDDRQRPPTGNCASQNWCPVTAVAAAGGRLGIGTLEKRAASRANRQRTQMVRCPDTGLLVQRSDQSRLARASRQVCWAAGSRVGTGAPPLTPREGPTRVRFGFRGSLAIASACWQHSDPCARCAGCAPRKTPVVERRRGRGPVLEPPAGLATIADVPRISVFYGSLSRCTSVTTHRPTSTLAMEATRRRSRSRAVRSLPARCLGAPYDSCENGWSSMAMSSTRSGVESLATRGR